MQSENVGKKIKRISISKNKVTVYFDEEKIALSHDLFTSSYLFKGKELSDIEIAKLKKDNDISLALEYAKKVLSKGVYTEWKMREKLYAKEYTKEIVDETIDRLKKEKLIDDLTYIKEYIVYGNEQLYGKNKIIQKLKMRGVFDENIAKIHFSEAKEIEKAKKLLPKFERKYRNLSLVDKKQHIVNAYINNGYDSHIAIKMSELLKSVPLKVEQENLKKHFMTAAMQAKRKYSDEKKIKETIFNKLMMRGYRYQDIVRIWEENKYEIIE